MAEKVKAVYTGTNPIQHAHGVLKPNQGMVELEKDNYDKLKKLFPSTLKSADESAAEYNQTGESQVGEQEEVEQPRKAGRPPKQ